MFALVLLTGGMGSILAIHASAQETAGAAAEAPADQAAASDASAPAVSPEAAAARKAFDAELVKWQDVSKQITAARQERAKVEGDAAATIDKQIAELRTQGEATLTDLLDAGVAVYRVDPKAYPDVNSTLLYIGQFFIAGDSRGDGGDQYEKSLVLAKKLIDAGMAEQWPEIYAWGGVSAFCTGEVELAAQYFGEARKHGGLSDVPPTANPGDPRNRIHELAMQFESELPQMRSAWKKEQEIRAAEAQADDLPRVQLVTTRGEIELELFENEAPIATANFLSLVKKGYYDGVVFHRVLPGFMAQGGDPTGTGTGGPGYSIACECYKPEFRHHFRGSLSMAHAGRDTGGSQFFLTFIPTSQLDGRHTVFGRIVKGMDVASAIRRRDPDFPVGTPDKIITAKVVRDSGQEYEFEKLPGR
jgi:cyclophilin family peptidyl-prolyl cis-trans isomerase